ncbi:Lrp/AsnC family transcriptional regulator [Qingshengfaniella alkalisoli]|uniref:Lrp/AsnC family transcriptional regulator n=1 Tax=Qingshengfaniella alkalisoli TaxID=2599296 RepID=A0A5B8J3J6_9RHOB|nr:Lrp/AsnC family transcriptional regulator [Qingshengfaniella alkalisoli]QDY71651.1 Lrp/AsnC family transcriptional regulator [Qingshengfaniella alkalisoli]
MPILTSSDRRVIAALRTNARASVTELAHMLGLSRTTVKSRIDKLVEDGIIRQFTIITDTDNDPSVRAIMAVELQGSMSRSVIRAIKALPEVTAVHSTNGAWDLIVEIRTETLRDFDHVLREVRSISGVRNSETSLLLDTL